MGMGCGDRLDCLGHKLIYVDPLRDYGWVLRGHKVKNCHMTTDGPVDDLHRMAEAIGMKRAWFQPWPKFSVDHYDLTPSRRAKAVELGALELTSREAYNHWKEWQAARKAKDQLDVTGNKQD